MGRTYCGMLWDLLSLGSVPREGVKTLHANFQKVAHRSCVHAGDILDRFKSTWLPMDDFTAIEPAVTLTQPDEEAEEVDTNGEVLWPSLVPQSDDLYSEVLHTLVHMIGCDVTDKKDQAGLISHLQKAFNVDNDVHEKLLQATRCKEAPHLELKVQVTEARNLRSKDVNDSSNPFCILSISSNINHNQSTSVKQNTLSPVWKEDFSFPMTIVQEDVLHIEVLDYDYEDTVVDKLKRIGDVKSPRGFKILVKEVAFFNKSSHNFLGAVTIPTNSIPSTGLEEWFPLQGQTRKKTRHRGEIKLKLRLCTGKDKDEALQQFRQLLQLLLRYTLTCSEIKRPYQWINQFPPKTTRILSQQACHGNLSDTDIALAKWTVYSEVHLKHHLNYQVFNLLLEKLQKPIQDGKLTEDEELRFWTAANMLVNETMIFIKRLHHQSARATKLACIQLHEALKTMATLIMYLPEEWTDSSINWNVRPVCKIYQKIRDAAKTGAEEFLDSIFEKNPLTSEIDKPKLNELLNIVRLVTADLRRTKQSYRCIFYELLDVDYFAIICAVYDSKITPLIKSLVMDICNKLKPLSLNESKISLDSFYKTQLQMSMGLFTLYQDLLVARMSSCQENAQDFYEWFKQGVAIWLDIAHLQAKTYIVRAVQKDTMVTVDEHVKHSSSAVDTIIILHQLQIKTFWTQIETWPDLECRYTFATKIIDDLSQCLTHYCKLMWERMRDFQIKSGRYAVIRELGLAINNMDFVQDALRPNTNILELEGLIDTLAERDGQEKAQQHIAYILGGIEKQIQRRMDYVGQMMAREVYKFMSEGATLGNDVDGLIAYLSSNWNNLHYYVNKKRSEYFFAILWANVLHVILYLINNNLYNQRSPSFFKNIHEAVRVLINFFEADPMEKSLQKIQNVLLIHGMDTWDIIQAYHHQRHHEQEDMAHSEHGTIAVKAHICGNHLKIEVMNAGQIRPVDSSGSCNPYVQITLVPEGRFSAKCQKMKTRVQKEYYLHPLFEESFSIPLIPEEMSMKGNFIMFTLKHSGLLGCRGLFRTERCSRFMAEAYLPIDTIPRTDGTGLFQDLEPVVLALSQPTPHDSVLLKVLQSREKWDHVARDFLKNRMKNMSQRNIA